MDIGTFSASIMGLSAGTLTSAVESGITGGFNNIGHTVNIWLWSLSSVLLLFLLFGYHLAAMIQEFVNWIHPPGLGSAQAMAQVLTANHISAPKGHFLNGWSSPWTPGWNATGVAGHTLFAIPWSPAWAVAVGGLWAIGTLLGVLGVFRGKQSGRLTWWMPLTAGVVIFVGPWILPNILGAVWGQWGGVVAEAIGSSVGMSAHQSLNFGNPFWIWGALWGISGPNGMSITKIPGLIALPLAAGIAGGVAHVLISTVQTATGELSLLRDTADFLYPLFDIGVLMTVGLTVITTLWTMILVAANLWLGIAPVWIWIIALNPWDPETMFAVLGVALRALAMQLGAWIWVAGVVWIDGGANGPFGLSPGFSGFVPWLSMIWTLVWMAIGWRFWVIPTWFLIRHFRINVADWWSHTVASISNLGNSAGQQAIDYGESMKGSARQLMRLGVKIPGALGDVTGTAGVFMDQWGATLQSHGSEWQQRSAIAQERSAWRAAQVGWTDTELRQAQQSQMGIADNLMASSVKNPAKWATDSRLKDPEPMSTITWQQDGSHFVGKAQNAEQAAAIAESLQKDWVQQGFTATPNEWSKKFEGQVKTWAQSQARQEVAEWKDPQGRLMANVDPTAAKRWVEARTQALQAWRMDTEYSDQAWARSAALPVAAHQDGQITISPRAGTLLPPSVAATLQQPTTHETPLERQRLGRREVLKQGVWVVQPHVQKTKVPDKRPSMPSPPPPEFPNQ